MKARRLLCGLLPVLAAFAQDSENLLVVVNQNDPLSRRIAAYYVHKRSVPLDHVCKLSAPAREEISWEEYQGQVETAVAACLARGTLAETVLYIVTTRGVPLKVAGSGKGAARDSCAVDSELALLYGKRKGMTFPRAGVVNNPFFAQTEAAFSHRRFPIYLVTRLAGYDFEDVRGMIDRSLAAHNRGKFVIDLKSDNDSEGNNWLRTAGLSLPESRVLLDTSEEVVYGVKDVIGYAGWGSNDPHRLHRFLGFQWLPGAIATEFVSTDARTFERPPDSWKITTWKDSKNFFGGSPQTLTADYIHEGATGCSGHVYEPYLGGTPRPNYLLPAYFRGRNLAESYYLSLPFLSWQNVVIGDPLCHLGKPE